VTIVCPYWFFARCLAHLFVLDTDFDHDGDGYVSFQEYAQQMALQAQKAEQEQLYGDMKNSQKNQALQDLYKDASKGSSAQYKNNRMYA
jgi:hypothetical protein